MQIKTYIDEYEKVDENKLKELIKYPKKSFMCRCILIPYNYIKEQRRDLHFARQLLGA